MSIFSHLVNVEVSNLLDDTLRNVIRVLEFSPRSERTTNVLMTSNAGHPNDVHGGGGAGTGGEGLNHGREFKSSS